MTLSSTSLSSISIVFILFLSNFMLAQNDTIVIDSKSIKQSYGIRLGGDLGKLARSFVDNEYKGFEIMGDYRLTNKIYLAGELGNEEKITQTDYLSVTSSGSYFKAGIDYNFYQNWLDMDNMIYAGLRVGASSFKHELNSYTIYNTDQYYGNQVFISDGQEFNGLTAIWGELIIGLKAEILANLYMGLNIQFKGLVSEEKPSNFENLYIPGYNRTYDSGSLGFGYGYFMAYRIPLYKKSK